MRYNISGTVKHYVNTRRVRYWQEHIKREEDSLCALGTGNSVWLKDLTVGSTDRTHAEWVEHLSATQLHKAIVNM